MNQQNNQPLHILLIDDKANDRLWVAQHLNRTFSNLHLTEVSQAAELSQALQRDDVDLVITDYQIGWTNGLAVLEASKARWPDCPVIMFTATGNEEIAVQAMKGGADDYILKSAQQLPRLSAAIQSALAKSQHRRTIFDEEGRRLEGQSVERPVTEHKHIKNSLEQLNRELALLNRASQAFISTLDLDEVLNSVLQEVRNSLNVIACSVWLIDLETKERIQKETT